MSIINSTIFASKLKPFFFKTSVNFSFKADLFIWPNRLSYDAWQNLMESRLWFIGSNHHMSLKNSKNRNREIEDLPENEIADIKTEIIIDELKTQNLTKNEDTQLDLITVLKQFLERKHISQHIENTIPDRRNQDLITYSKQSIMMCALAIFLFRMNSGNKFDDKSHDKDEKYSEINMAKFIDSSVEDTPVIKTIEKFLTNLKENSINDLMIAFFKDLQHSKFFTQHPQIMPGDFFLLAADCVHTHTYEHPHHLDVNGNNDCDCCLKRIYNKKTENEKVKWLHNTLVFSFIFMGGLKIPIYSYPIHAKQIVNLENASDNDHKQECELVALKMALPIIREAFPRMKIVLLLDGLYANRPVIRLAEKNRCGFIIVRKEATLPSLAKECDERSVEANHKKNCVKKSQRLHQGWHIEQKYEWFNTKYLGEEAYVNVLRFCEIRTKEGKNTESYKCEWLFSWRLSANSCEIAVRQARSRWEIEDLFNTLKNRGYNLRHDYSRNPRSCFNWQGIALLAFGIFELFRFSEAVRQRGDWPQSTLAEKLLAQLLNRPTNEIFSEKCLSKRLQFRYHFVVERIFSGKNYQETSRSELKSG